LARHVQPGFPERVWRCRLFVCPGCYQALDTFDGIGEVGDKIFNLAGRSRGNCAPRYNRAKYDAYQQREALKLSVDHGRPSSPAAR